MFQVQMYKVTNFTRERQENDQRYQTSRQIQWQGLTDLTFQFLIDFS